MARRFLVLGAASFAVLTLVACKHDLTPSEQINAETGARRSLKVFEGCSGLDSDGDGYVTCSGREADGGPVVTLMCSYQGTAVGCKRK